MSTKTIAVSLLALGLVAVPLAQGKLPPLSPDLQAKADEAKAKSAWTDKVAAYQLCRAMDRVAEGYYKGAKSSGKDTHAPTATPPCADPGPYTSAAAASAPKPLEASGAHSPPATATSPPSSKATEAQIAGQKK
jgi:hypothetical protein